MSLVRYKPIVILGEKSPLVWLVSQHEWIRLKSGYFKNYQERNGG